MKNKLDDLYKYIEDLEKQVVSNCLREEIKDYQKHFQWGYSNALRLIKKKINKLKEE